MGENVPAAKNARPCRDAEHHADGTGYYDPNGHEITAERWHEATRTPISSPAQEGHDV